VIKKDKGTVGKWQLINKEIHGKLKLRGIRVV
jgi:hypothetical protein